MDVVGARKVSILSPQQRGLQSSLLIRFVIIGLFQFSAPNKGDCNVDWSTGIFRDEKVSILSPQQRGLQYVETLENEVGIDVSILSPQQRGLQ